MSVPPWRSWNEQPASSASPATERVRRADYSQVLHHEENYIKASAVREESMRRRDELRAQRERFRMRGQMLKAQREAGQAQIKSSLTGCHEEALRMGTEQRVERERLRAERTSRQAQWAAHGRELTAQHEQLRERLKASAEELQEERSRETQLLRAQIKKLNQQVDDTILAQNRERRDRVVSETSREVVRASKQYFADDRWSAADELRESLGRLRERQREQEAAYLDRAHQTKQQARIHSSQAADEQAQAAKARAAELRAWEKEMDAQRKIVRDEEIARKRSVHETVEEAKLVPDDDVIKPDDPEAGPLQMFTRFFGFRKRGTGHVLSSVGGGV